jgi:hypothetical protein
LANGVLIDEWRVCYPPPVHTLLIALFVLPLLQAQPKTVCANVWKDRTAEVEQFLRTAKVEKVADIPIGVTRPRRAYLTPGGIATSFAWKVLPPGSRDGYFESYKSEIAAYELDKLLALNMVPVVVERRVNNDTGAAVLWLEGVQSWETVLPLPKPASWSHEIARMKMFDDLIGNSDRNKGNLLVDDEWHLFLIDHSRAFATDTRLPQELQSIDRRLWESMLKLDEATVRSGLGQWLDSRQIQMLLRRRDAMRKKIDALLAKSGASVFF